MAIVGMVKIAHLYSIGRKSFPVSKSTIMKHISILFFLIMPSLLLAQSKWQIPGVNEQPQWAMPFFFEDANGVKDTVWIGYDQQANVYAEGYDSIYNEYQKVDTSRFQVILFPGAYSPFMTLPVDSAYKVAVQGSGLNIKVGFINGKLPITMKWADTLLYSDSLPYRRKAEHYPIAWIELTCINGEAGYGCCRPPFAGDPPIIFVTIL